MPAASFIANLSSQELVCYFTLRATAHPSKQVFFCFPHTTWLAKQFIWACLTLHMFLGFYTQMGSHPHTGECLLKVTSRLTILREEMTLALCNLGLPFAKVVVTLFCVFDLTVCLSYWIMIPSLLVPMPF